jgi:hypothetical protein
MLEMKETLSWYSSMLREYGVARSRAGTQVRGIQRRDPYKLKPSPFLETDAQWENLDPSAAIEFFA